MRIALHLLAFPVLLFIMIATARFLFGLPALLGAVGTWWGTPLSATAFLVWITLCVVVLLIWALSLAAEVLREGSGDE